MEVEKCGQSSKFDLIDFIIHSFEVEVTTVVTDCRDVKDNKFPELAIDGQAECIVTGDKDLLVLHPYRNISILTPNAFLESRGMNR